MPCGNLYSQQINFLNFIKIYLTFKFIVRILVQVKQTPTQTETIMNTTQINQIKNVSEKFNQLIAKNTNVTVQVNEVTQVINVWVTGVENALRVKYAKLLTNDLRYLGYNAQRFPAGQIIINGEI
jgi:formylmethanofuran dehydrogenase subunit C